MNMRRVLFTDHRNPTFIALAAGTSAFALRPDATLVPTVILLSLLLTYSPFLFRADEPHRAVNIGLTAFALSIGSVASRVQASLHALSSPAQSVLWLASLSLVLSAISLAALFVGTKFSTRFSSSWSQITLFPSIWATLWCTISYISPVGHLSTWSIANNADAYNWVVPFLGPAAKDWIVGAWAVVISQTITSWYMGAQDHEDELDLFSTPSQKPKLPDNSSSRKLLAFFLVALTTPSFYLSNFPLPISEISTATPLSVACVIPPYQRYKHHAATLDDYISETGKLVSTAKLLLWPEGAVVFHSAEERDNAFKKIIQNHGSYVGVSFEETISDPSDPTGRKALTRTGLAVISRYLEEPHMIYYKRNLVPVAESYRFGHSSEPPTIFELQLSRPEKQGISPTDWSPNANHTRPIPLSASICLDFATPRPFSGLESRPGLILAPARTWDRDVGYAMWLQAKQRAEEQGSMVLWCDGGAGGVSGVGGGGFNDVTQVGEGSFVRTIGLQYPFNTTRTPFARYGDSVLIVLWAFILAPGIFKRRALQLGYLRHGVEHVLNLVRGRRSAPVPLIEPRDLLD